MLVLCELVAGLPGDYRLDTVQTPHIRRFIAQMHARGLGGRSLARRLSAWRGFYRWLGVRGEMTVNPVEGIRAPKSPKALPKLLSPDEASRLLDSASDAVLEIRDQAMFELFYSSGLRLAELAALDVACVDDLLAGEVRVLGKRNKLRLVPGAVDVGLSQQDPKKELKIELNRGLANSMGISAGDAAQALRVAFAGIEVGDWVDPTGETGDVAGRLHPDDRLRIVHGEANGRRARHRPSGRQ